jgi:hypothetical protein
MAIKWIKAGSVKAGEVKVASAGPFTMKVEPTGDGRFTWGIWSGDTPNPAATGVASSFGAARAAAENYVNRSGHV